LVVAVTRRFEPVAASGAVSAIAMLVRVETARKVAT
jgi:hypothetical protein